MNTNFLNATCTTFQKLKTAIKNRWRDMLFKGVILQHDDSHPHMAIMCKVISVVTNTGHSRWLYMYLGNSRKLLSGSDSPAIMRSGAALKNDLAPHPQSFFCKEHKISLNTRAPVWAFTEKFHISTDFVPYV